jgi:hypothetical protein
LRGATARVSDQSWAASWHEAPATLSAGSPPAAHLRPAADPAATAAAAEPEAAAVAAQPEPDPAAAAAGAASGVVEEGVPPGGEEEEEEEEELGMSDSALAALEGGVPPMLLSVAEGQPKWRCHVAWELAAAAQQGQAAGRGGVPAPGDEQGERLTAAANFLITHGERDDDWWRAQVGPRRR